MICNCYKQITDENKKFVNDLITILKHYKYYVEIQITVDEKYIYISWKL
jgi:hypothetical protein